MPGRIKALQKGKTYRYNVNRKRVDKQIRSVGTIKEYVVFYHKSHF